MIYDLAARRRRGPPRTLRGRRPRGSRDTEQRRVRARDGVLRQDPPGGHLPFERTARWKEAARQLRSLASNHPKIPRDSNLLKTKNGLGGEGRTHPRKRRVGLVEGTGGR